jgi:DNA-binding response OmpR family regulator
MSAQRVPAVLVVDDFNPFSRLIRHVLRQRRFAVFCASSAAKGLALFQAHRSQIDLAVIDMVRPVAANLDLTAELERLRPGLPVLYIAGALKTVARCSIEAQAPDSVLVAPFTEEQLIARVGSLLAIEATVRERPNEQLWEQLIAGSVGISSGAAMLYVYGLSQAGLAKGHAAMLRAGDIRYAFRPTNYEPAPCSIIVRTKDMNRARHLIAQVPAGGRPNLAA